MTRHQSRLLNHEVTSSVDPVIERASEDGLRGNPGGFEAAIDAKLRASTNRILGYDVATQFPPPPQPEPRTSFWRSVAAVVLVFMIVGMVAERNGTAVRLTGWAALMLGSALVVVLLPGVSGACWRLRSWRWRRRESKRRRAAQLVATQVAWLQAEYAYYRGRGESAARAASSLERFLKAPQVEEFINQQGDLNHELEYEIQD